MTGVEILFTWFVGLGLTGVTLSAIWLNEDNDLGLNFFGTAGYLIIFVSLALNIRSHTYKTFDNRIESYLIETGKITYTVKGERVVDSVAVEHFEFLKESK